MISYPNAKVNLGLNILRKRQDGFHEIESVFYPVPWKDILEVVPAESGSGKAKFSSSGIPVPADGKPNLCEQVYHLLNEEFGLPAVNIHLHKIIPIGAGLGGGSADAAQTGLLLNDLFSLNLSSGKLESVVARVGSDCPFFIKNEPAFVTGRGEVLEAFDLDLSGYWMILVNPGIHIGTAEAYSGITPQVPEISLKDLIQQDVGQWKATLRNDFEASVFTKYPAINDLKSRLYGFGATYASMTGSGSTVIGLFEDEPIQLDFPSDYSVKIVRL